MINVSKGIKASLLQAKANKPNSRILTNNTTGIKKGNSPAYLNISGEINTLEKRTSEIKKVQVVINFIGGLRAGFFSYSKMSKRD